MRRDQPLKRPYPKARLAKTITSHAAARTLTADVMTLEPWTIRFDGGVRGNGRPDARGLWAFILYDPHGDIVRQLSGGARGKPVTVNTCEWQGLTEGLEAAAGVAAIHALLIEGDSDLVISQLVGYWRVSEGPLAEWRAQALNWLVAVRAPWYARWIPREKNGDCDALTH